MTALQSVRSALAALAGAVRRGRPVPEPEAEAEEIGALDWDMHAATLRGWIMARPEDREGSDEPGASGAAEQTNAMVRDYFMYHNLDEHLEYNPDSAFVAYSMAELYTTVIAYWMMLMRSSGVFTQMPVEAQSLMHRTLFVAVTTIAQRPSWYAAAHLTGAFEPEPFGDLIPPDQLPPMIVTEKKNGEA